VQVGNLIAQPVAPAQLVVETVMAFVLDFRSENSTWTEQN